MKATRVSLWRTGVALFLVIVVYGDRCHGAAPTEAECILCHGVASLRSSRGEILFIDPKRFSESVHGKMGFTCASCHEGITSINPDKRVPHRVGIEPKCPECHQKENRTYSRSRHAEISKKICYSCHNPHYSISFHQMSGHDRQRICLKCHESTGTHRWLPQKALHFNYLECTSCHDLNAEIGMVLYIVDRNDRTPDKMLDYARLAPFIDPGKKGLIETIDQDEDRKLSEPEISSFMKKLRENGVPGASLQVRILVLKPAHNFTDRGEKTRDCSLCHSRDAKFYSKLFLEVPEREGELRTAPVERQILAHRGEDSFLRNFYLLGESKIRAEDLRGLLDQVRRIGFKWLDLIGVFAIIMALAAITFHAMLMFLTRKLRTRLRLFERAEPLPFAVRAWHWVHGFFVVMLVLTGIQLRLPDVLPIFATFLNAVNLHNLSGAVVIVDYIFWLSYHIWRKEFRHRFVVSPRDLVGDTAEILHYYGYLIFVGESYPRRVLHGSDFDPFEKAFFLTIMLVFVPIQILTGAMLYDLFRMMPVINFFGGIRVIDAAHLTTAYLLTACVIIHTYLHSLKKYRFIAP
jgi:thiosulfate reductase cytochrome b subunit